jgi:myxalamid-type polyketide synthase MxaE and MxaD
MANYAAANTALDAFVQRRRARCEHGLSIQWGPWSGVGMLAQADARNVDALEREGVEPLNAKQAVECFHALLAQAEPTVAVLGIDWAAYEAAHRGRPMTIFRDRSTDDAETDQHRVVARLAIAPPHERRKLLGGVVAEALGAVLKLAPGGIDVRRPFGSLGLDSLMALELRNRLESALERPLPATLAWNYPTVESLTDHLDGLTAVDLGVVPAPEPTAEPDHTAPRVLADVGAMSDDEALRVLRGGA